MLQLRVEGAAGGGRPPKLAGGSAVRKRGICLSVPAYALRGKVLDTGRINHHHQASMSSAPQNADNALHDRAAQDLQYIRSAMERAGSFTAVSGRGYILLGVSALVASALGARTSSFSAWLSVWGAELVIAASIAIVTTAQKARRIGLPIAGGAGRKLLLGFTPVMAAGGALSFALLRAGAGTLLPGMWVAIYGAAVIAGGVYSIRPVPILGATQLAVGIVALLLPVIPADIVLAVGFGVLHIVWGILIARRHGG